MSNYDFSRLQEICEEILSSRVPGQILLNKLRAELNRFFKDSKCLEVLYNKNNDKLFYGMCVLPKTNNRDFMNIYNGTYNRMYEYYIEIDSKILNPVLDLTPTEFMAILLHEVGHVVNNTMALRDISDQIHYIISKEGIELDYIDAIQHNTVLEIGLLRALRKSTSLFEKQKQEYIADEFVVSCGYGAELESAYNKTVNKANNLNTNSSRFVAMMWAIQTHLMSKRINMIRHNLEEANDVEPIILFRRKYKEVLRHIDLKGRMSRLLESSIDTKVEEYISESRIFKFLKYPGLKGIEDDLYEFRIKMNIIDSNAEALEMIRQINLRISTISNYVVKEKISGDELDRMLDIKNKYISLREDLINKGTYEKSEYGLFVKYPKINGMSRL